MPLTQLTLPATGSVVYASNDGTGNSQVMQVGFGAVGTTPTLADKAGNELPIQSAPRLVYAAASSITRPANTTAYAQNDAVANSTTAGSVTPFSWTVSDQNNAPFILRRIKLDTTSTGIAGIGFRMFLFNASPTALSGDHAAFSASKANCVGVYAGVFKVLSGTGTGFSDGDISWLTPEDGSELICVPTSGAKTLFGLMQTTQAFTPSSAATFTPTLEGFFGRP